MTFIFKQLLRLPGKDLNEEKSCGTMIKLAQQFFFRIPVLLVILLVFISAVSGINVRKRTSVLMNGQLIEHFYVSSNDTTIKHGAYQLFYKTHLIESGQFMNGRKVGVWTYCNLGNVLEFKYDYDSDSLVLIAGGEQQDMLAEASPCMFLGSSLVPYAHISTLVGYPAKAYDRGMEGKVDLFMVISPEGQITRRYTGTNDPRLLANPVLKASYSFPEEWSWIPERQNNQKQESIYKITIFFELKK